MRNESFKQYVSNLKIHNSILKPINIGENPHQHHPQYANTQHLRNLGKKCDEEKVDLFTEHLSEAFSPHNNDLNQEAEH
jgi:hypothetical protein